MRRLPSIAVLALGLAVALISTAPVGAETSVLGPDGEVYRLVAGTYGDLFSGVEAAAAKTPVLALDVLTAESRQRHAIPGTVGSEREHSARMLLEPDSGMLYVVWAADRELVATRVALIGFDTASGGWTEIVDVSGDPFSFKGAPSLAASRDTILADDGSPVSRTILHAVWWEQNGLRAQVVYAPLVFHDGRFVGRGEAAILNDLFAAGSSEPIEGLVELARRPDVHAEPGGKSVTVTFLDGERNELVAGQIRIVAGALERFGNRLRDHLLSQAVSCSDGLEGLADTTFAATAGIEDPLLDKTLRDYLALTASAWVAGRPELCDPRDEGELLALVEEARGHIILIGLRATDTRSPYRKARGHIILIGFRQAELPLVSTGAELLNRVGLPEGSWQRLYVSPDGEKMIVARDGGEGRAIEYRELGGEGWNETLRLVIDADLDRDEADRVLRRRVGAD